MHALPDIPPHIPLTTGSIARLLGVSRDRVEYAVRARGIRHHARAGNVRVFDRDAAERVAEEIGRSRTGEGASMVQRVLPDGGR